MEHKIEVKTFKVILKCDKCKDGIMKYNGIVLTSNPPLFPHVCNKCGYKQNIRGKKYPHIVTEEIQE